MTLEKQSCTLKSNRHGRLVIIGGGSAAFAAATAAASEAYSITIVNKGLPMGGCCVNVGCVPSKFLIQAAQVISPHNSCPPFQGISKVEDRVVDFAKLTSQNIQLTERLQREKYASVIADLDNVAYVEGYGRLCRKDGILKVQVRSDHNDKLALQTLEADRVIIASGSTTYISPFLAQDLAKVDFLTNETAYFQSECPASLIILGGGYVAMEASQMFARLGSKVTILQRSEQVLSELEGDIGIELANYLKREGIQIEVGVHVESIIPHGDMVRVKTTCRGVVHTFTASKIFVATGRRANTEHISDIPIKMATTMHGGIVVSETLETSISGVYAAGDCIAGSPQYVYTAATEGKLAATNALGSLHNRKPSVIDYKVVPWVIFTSPAVAGVGYSLSEARQLGIDADASTIPLDLLPRAIVQQNTNGFVTLVRDKANDCIIGARVLAEEGGELIMEASLAVHFKATATDLAAMFHPYLTWNEAWKLAALGFTKNVKKLSCCAT